MIDGVLVHPLRQIPDERGKVMHMLRSDDPHFERFGEIYFSVVYPGAVKAWHRYGRMTRNYAVPKGMIRLVLYDDRQGSPTRGEIQEVFVGECSYLLVRIPPGVWSGFQGLGVEPALVADCATHPHDPGDVERASPTDDRVPYDWGRMKLRAPVFMNSDGRPEASIG